MYLGNTDFVLNKKENLHTTTAVTLTRQQNILLSLICILKYLANHLDMLDQPCAWHLKRIFERTLSYLHCILWIWATLLWRPCSPWLSPCPSIYTKPDFRRQCAACGPIPELETAMRKQNRATSWAVAHDCGHHTSLKKQIASCSFFPLHHAPHTFLRLSFACLQCSIGCFRYVSWLIPSF